MDKIARIKELVEQLDAASKAYYQEDREILSNFEYDTLYDELLTLEGETGFVMSNSPSQKVGYTILGDLQKEKHEFPMLSLDKTKEVLVLKKWLKDQIGLLSWKLDGLTIVLTYKNGALTHAVTRGSGEVGEVITNNAKVFKNIPLNISFKEELVLRGEAVIKYSDFYKINETITEEADKYKNPRNLCSGTVRQLNNEITAKRNVHFFAFQVVKAGGVDFENSKEKQLLWLKKQGFETVFYRIVDKDNIEDSVAIFSDTINNNDFGSDGLVLTYDDMNYSANLGATSKFPRDSIAFKWSDEIRETTFKFIEWSTSRTGSINPIAIFEPVELEGTTVSRASLHNLSILESLELGSGDKIEVYKANMIIPQVSDNLSRSGGGEIPNQCPVCKGITAIKQVKEVKVLFCTNPLCEAKKIKAFSHFVSRDALNIDGLSEATLEKFIQKGYLSELSDLFHIAKYKDEIIELEGFGLKSYTNLMLAIDKSRAVSLAKFIYGLGISNVGLSNAKLICKYFENTLEKIMDAQPEEFIQIQGIGIIIANEMHQFFAMDKNRQEVLRLSHELRFEIEETTVANAKIQDKTFVITGSVEHFKNRKELQTLIEQKGGKVTGSVTNNTDYLINNDTTSNSSKNKKAKDLGIPILSEEDFIVFLQ